MLGRPGDASFADRDAGSRGQEHVDDSDFAELGEDSPRLVAETGGGASLGEGLPQDVGQEADEDVGEDAVLLLVPDGSNPQVGFVDAERGQDRR